MSENQTEDQIRLLLVPLEDIVVFPNMNVTLTVDVGDEDRAVSYTHLTLPTKRIV